MRTAVDELAKFVTPSAPSTAQVKRVAIAIAQALKPPYPFCEALNAIEELCAVVEAIKDWDSTTGASLPMYAEILAKVPLTLTARGSSGESRLLKVDERFYDLDLALLSALREHASFLLWLAETFPPPDANFTSSVEMAMGRPEMDTLHTWLVHNWHTHKCSL
eukprot:427883-Amphidinium_carterae.1